MYTLYISRYGRHLTFDTIEELREELGTYFTPSEKKSGIVDRLTTFNAARCKDGYIKNDYRDMSVCYYPDTDN